VLIALTLFGLFLSCEKRVNQFDVDVIGHAASGLDVDRVPFPGNTQQSIDYARALGAKKIELDIQLSSDNHWVLFHNDQLDLHTSKSGCIGQYTLNDLQHIEYVGHPNIKLLALKDVQLSGIEKVYLDLRHYNPCTGFSLIEPTVMIPELLEFKTNHPNTTVVLITTRWALVPFFNTNGFQVWYESVSYENILNLYSSNMAAGFVIRNKSINKEQVIDLKSKNVELIIYDLKSYEGNVDAMKKSPNFVMTDALASALILSKKYE